MEYDAKVAAISLILLIVFSSFLGLSLCGEDTHIPCQSAGYDADCGQDLNHFCIVAAVVVIGLLHGVHLHSARRFVLCLTLPNGDEPPD